MKFIVDVQGFAIPKGNAEWPTLKNGFIVKELAVCKVQPLGLGNDISTALVKAPFPWDQLPNNYKKTNLWLTHHFHGIPWKAGEIEYSEMESGLRKTLKPASYIFVKGKEKKLWLQEILQSIYFQNIIIDLEDMGCPSLDKLRVSMCTNNPFHKELKNYHCASENSRRLRIWLLETYGDYPSANFSITLLQYSKLHDLETEDIAMLPEEFILHYKADEIDRAFNILPVKYRMNKRFQDNLICFGHLTDSENCTQNDGPRPKIKNCFKCQSIEKVLVKPLSSQNID